MALNNVFRGFREKRGCGTDIIEAKLLQQLAFVEQCSMYGVFLGLRKARNAMDRSSCMRIFEDCSVRPKILRLVQRFCEAGILLCKASGCYEDPYQAWQGVTQVGPVTPTIFNLMVDAVI